MKIHLHSLVLPLGYSPVVDRIIVPRLVFPVLVVILFPPPASCSLLAAASPTGFALLVIRHDRCNLLGGPPPGAYSDCVELNTRFRQRAGSTVSEASRLRPACCSSCAVVDIPSGFDRSLSRALTGSNGPCFCLKRTIAPDELLSAETVKASRSLPSHTTLLFDCVDL